MLHYHMEGEIAGQENPRGSTSDTALNSMPSAIETDSISIELVGAITYNARGMDYHDHFSLRGFVAGVRERDWLKCYPLPLGDSDDKTDRQRQLLPPLDAPKHKWWRCKCCVDELCAEKGKQASNSECSAQMPRIGNHQDMETDLLEERTIYSNHCNVGYTDHHACLIDEREKTEVAKITKIGNQMSFGGNASGLVTVLKSASPKVNPILMPEGHKNDACSEIDGLSDNEPAIRNLKWMAKCASESCKSGELTMTANQRHTESTKACPKVAEGTVAKVADNGLQGQPTGFSLPDSENCNSLTRKHDNSSEKDSQDHNLDKLSSLHRRKARKVRLLADLLGENTKNKHVRIQETQENGTYNIPAVLSALSGPQDKWEGQIHLKSIGPNRKRKVPLEEVDIFAKKVVDKALQNTEEDADNDNVIQNSRSEDPWTYGVLQNGLSKQWNNAEGDRRPFMVKNNKKKIREAEAACSREEERENFAYDNGATQVGPSDNLDLKLAPATFAGHEMPLFPLHDDSENASTLSKRKDKMPQICENLASISCKNGQVIDIPMHQSEKILQMGQIAAYKEKGIDKGLQLSLNSCLAAQSYDRELVAPCDNTQLVPHFKNRLSISFPREVSTSKVDQVVRKEMRSAITEESSICLPYGLTNIYGKGIVGEPSSQTANFRMPVTNENTYRPQVHDAIHIYKQQKELTGSSKNQRTVEAQNSSVVVKKQFHQTSDNVAEQGDIDDIPMEIVELMAKNQYERGLPDAGRTNCLLQPNNLRRNQQMVNWVTEPGSGEFMLLKEETSQKRKSKERDGRNGFVVTGENDGVHKGKSVGYFSHFAANCHNIKSRGQSQNPFVVEDCRSKKKSPSDFPIFPGNSSGLSDALSYKWNDGTLGYKFSPNSGQDSGGCDRHKTIFHPDGEAFRIWTATTSKHLHKGYASPTKDTSQSINMDMLSHGSALLRDHKIQRHDNVQVFNLNPTNAGNPNTDYGTESSIRSRAGFPFPSKPSGIELQKSSSRGSEEFYSNDTIPAMHLLNLMQSGTSFDVNACAVTQNGSTYPHDCNAELDIGTSRDRNYAKQLPSNHFGNNFRTQKSNCSFRGSPPFGASTSLVQHDRSLLRYSNVTDEIFPKSGKKKMKSPKSNMQIRTSKTQRSSSFTGGESHKEYGVVPVQCSEQSFPAADDHVSIGCPHTGNENYANLNSQSGVACGTSRPLRKSLEPKICTINRNPADFSAPDAGNVYMIRGEDLRFEKAAHYTNVGFADQRGFKHHRNLKLTSQK